MRKPALYLILVFLSGCLVGVFGNRLYQMRSVSASVSGRPSSLELRRKYVTELRGRLHLSDDQVSKLQPILDATHRRVHEVMERRRPEMKAIEADQARQIRALLNPDQQAEFEKFRQEREKHRREFEKSR